MDAALPQSGPSEEDITLSIATSLRSLPREQWLRAIEKAFAKASATAPPVSEAQTYYEEAVLDSLGLEEKIMQAQGGLISSTEFAHRLNLTERTIRNYHRQGKIIGITKDNRNLRFPAWQIHNGALLPKLPEVLERLRQSHHDVEGMMIFFLYPAGKLGDRTPLDCLRRGETTEVLQTAATEGQMLP